MNARVAVALCGLLVLVTAGGAWWALRDDGAPSGAGPAAPEPSSTTAPPQSPASPGPTLSPRPLPGRPVADCAPEEPAGRIPDRYWGMHVTTPIGGDFPDAPIAAVNLTTSGVYWEQVETAPGQYDFSRVDAIVATARARRAQPMLVLGFTPSFHAQQPGSPTPRSTMPDEAAWRAWVTAAVERYGARLDYQVWPEPNIVSNWSGTPAQMARLSVIAGRIIHDRAPRARVVAPATTLRLGSQRRWMDRFWDTRVDGTPVAEVVDAVALDPFPLEDGGPEESLGLLCQAQQILDDNGVELPVWTNEINYGVPSGGSATDVVHYADEKQAAVVARTYLLHASLGIDRVYWLGWFSAPGMAVELERDGTTTPAGNTFSLVHGWLEGAERPSCRVDEGVHTCVVEDGQETRRIHWRVQGTSAVSVAEGAVRTETLTGQRRRVQAGDRIRVGQSPVAVLVRS